MNIEDAIILLRGVKMNKDCENCRKFLFCNNNNLLCRNQVIREFNKLALEDTFNKSEGEEK